MSYTTNFNLNWRVSYLESIIASIVPFLPINLANTLLGGNTANNTIVLTDGVDTSTYSKNGISQPATSSNQFGTSQFNNNVTIGTAGAPSLNLNLTDTFITQSGITSPNTLGNTNVNGNVVFAGNARRIIGDFDNATVVNRTLFRSAAPNANSAVGVIPSGTSTDTSLDLYTSELLTTYQRFRMFSTPSTCGFELTGVGGASLVPMNFQMGALTPLSIATNGDTTFSGNTTQNGNFIFGGTSRRIQADFSNGTNSSRLLFQNSAANQFTAVGVIPNGTATLSGIDVYNTSTPNTNSQRLTSYIDNTACYIQSAGLSPLPLNIQIGSTNVMTFNTTNIVSFLNPPTCSVSATTTNQLVNFNNFTSQSYTPVLTSSGGAGVPTYTTQIGRFVRINNLCVLEAEIQISAAGTLPAGDLRISLPVNNDAASRASFAIGIVIQINTSNVETIAYADPSASFITLAYRASATSTTFTNLTLADINTASFRILLGGSYTV